jgi:dUTP pyrophosphatase
MTRSSRVKVNVHRLAHAKGMPLPAYQSRSAAGMDLIAAVAAAAPVTLLPGQRALIPTGLIFELPAGTEAQVRPRSGLAAKHGVTVLNSPGTIDADYRGEVSVILINLGTEPFTIRRGERIAQMIIAPVMQAKLTETTKLSGTDRGAGGFGSTGITASKKARSAKPAANRKSVTPNTAVAKKSARKLPKRVQP